MKFGLKVLTRLSQSPGCWVCKNGLTHLLSCTTFCVCYIPVHSSVCMCMYAMYLCTPTCECACVRCTHVFPHVRVHVEVNGRCLPRLLSTLIFETWSLAEPGANQIGKNSWPVSSQDPPVSASPELELQVHGTVPRFYVGSRDLQLGHHACGASPLSTETSPHPSHTTFLQSL